MSQPYKNRDGNLSVSDAVHRVLLLHGLVDEFFVQAESSGYVELGPDADLWSQGGLLQPRRPLVLRAAGFGDIYQSAPFWITFVGGRASIPIDPSDYTTLIRMVRRADLGWAAKYGNVLLARALLALGDDVNGRSGEGMLPLHWAASCEQVGMVRLLLEHGADPNSLDCTGRTPLHHAAMSGNMELATLLLCGGANTCLVDDHGDTARAVAQMMGKHEVATLIGQVVSNQEARVLSGSTAAGSVKGGEVVRRRL